MSGGNFKVLWYILIRSEYLLCIAGSLIPQNSKQCSEHSWIIITYSFEPAHDDFAYQIGTRDLKRIGASSQAIIFLLFFFFFFFFCVKPYLLQ